MSWNLCYLCGGTFLSPLSWAAPNFIGHEDAHSSVPNGAYCQRFQLQKIPEDILNDAYLANLITHMKTKAITPVVYFFEHKTTGFNVALTPIVNYGEFPEKVPESIPLSGNLVSLTHIPYFPRQRLIVMINKPVNTH